MSIEVVWQDMLAAVWFWLGQYQLVIAYGVGVALAASLMVGLLRLLMGRAAGEGE